MPVIVPATTKDAALIAQISRDTFYDTFARHNTAADMQKFLNEQFTTAQLMQEVGVKGITFFLAYENDIPAGYIKLIENTHNKLCTGNAMEISRLYVTQQYTGKGIGKALMDTAIFFSQQAGKEVIWLGVWEHNSRAIDFYQRCGFEKFGEQEFLLGDDLQTDWVMKKTIMQ